MAGHWTYALPLSCGVKDECLDSALQARELTSAGSAAVSS